MGRWQPQCCLGGGWGCCASLLRELGTLGGGSGAGVLSLTSLLSKDYNSQRSLG